MVVAMAALEAKVMTPADRIACPGFLDLGDTRFHCWSRHGHSSLDMRGGLKNSCDVFFYEAARGFDIGVDLGIELPGARKGLMPNRAWSLAQGRPWNVGDTISCGIGQGCIQATPLALATYVSRIASGRAVQPHLTRSIGGVAQKGALACLVTGGMLIALRCRHQYGRLLALGISTNFFMYAFVNLAMVTGAIPVGGVPLPLVSHGGSAMLTVMFGFGRLMSVHVHRDVQFADRRED